MDYASVWGRTVVLRPDLKADRWRSRMWTSAAASAAVSVDSRLEIPLLVIKAHTGLLDS